MLERTYKSGYISDEKLISDLKELARRLARLPTARDVNAVWSGRSTKYYRRFGTWKQALKLAGLHERSFLVSDLQRVALFLNHTPTDQEMRQHGHYPITSFWRVFKSWSGACELAGLKPHTTFEGGPFRVPPYDYKRRDGRSVRLIGSYELRFAKVLDHLKLDWQTHGDYPPLPYKDASGKSHRYLPDFYVKSWGLYIETKGWYQDKDKIKMQLVARDNPSITVIVVGRDALAQFERTKRLPML